MTDTPVRVSVTSPDGRRIRACVRFVRVTPGSGLAATAASFQVPEAIQTRRDNGANTQPVATTVAIETGSVTWELEGYQLPPGSVDSVSVSRSLARSISPHREAQTRHWRLLTTALMRMRV